MSGRIERLIPKAFDYGKDRNYQERQFLCDKALYEFRAERVHNIKRAKLERYLLENFTIEIDQDELIVGRFPVNAPITEDEKAEREKIREYACGVGGITGVACAATGHRVDDYEKLINIGVKGILAEVGQRQSELDFSRPEDAEKFYFYEACKSALDGLCTAGRRYHEKLSELCCAEKDPARKEEYRVLADMFAWIPYNPARTFYEAMQSMWLLQFCSCYIGDITLTGRIDNYLYPFYKRDKEAGILTDEFAQELIESLYLKHNEIYDSWPASIMVGGVDRRGNPNWNELSYMCIKAIESTGLINPSVSVCYNDAMPDDLLNLCVEVISKGYTKPAIFNDKVVIQGMLDAGVAPEYARYYIHSTCVEITPIAASGVFVATPYINLNKAYEYILNGGKPIYGDDIWVNSKVDITPETFESFDGFCAKLKEVISQILEANLVNEVKSAFLRKSYASSPLASCFTDDCIALGTDAAAGGAKYNFIYPCFPGFLNLVDSLVAIKQAVFDKKYISFEELTDALKANFENDERLRQYLLNRCPKFGNDIDEADIIAGELYDFIKEQLRKFKTCIPNGTFHPSYFAWIKHGELGKVSAATPDGRLQGTALSECLGAVQGRDKNGPLAVMHSLDHIEQKYGIGGIATNFRFSKSLMTSPEGREALFNFIKEFMNDNNFEMQFNVVDQKVLLEAQKNPEQYKTLMVRVAGYSDYFVNLDPVIQNEVISRIEHGEF